MLIPFVIDNQQHRLADVLNELLAPSAGKPLDIATAYFAISGYRLVKARLHQVGAFRGKESADDRGLGEEVAGLAEQFGKQRAADATIQRLRREDLELICFEYLSG